MIRGVVKVGTRNAQWIRCRYRVHDQRASGIAIDHLDHGAADEHSWPRSAAGIYLSQETSMFAFTQLPPLDPPTRHGMAFGTTHDTIVRNVRV